MKVQVINTDFLHDGTYYKQNSIIDMPPDIVKKYPRNLIPLEWESSVKSLGILRKESFGHPFGTSDIPTGQDNSDADNMPVPSGIVKTKTSNKNKRGKKC